MVNVSLIIFLILAVSSCFLTKRGPVEVDETIRVDRVLVTIEQEIGSDVVDVKVDEKVEAVKVKGNVGSGMYSKHVGGLNVDKRLPVKMRGSRVLLGRKKSKFLSPLLSNVKVDRGFEGSDNVKVVEERENDKVVERRGGDVGNVNVVEERENVKVDGNKVEDVSSGVDSDDMSIDDVDVGNDLFDDFDEMMENMDERVEIDEDDDDGDNGNNDDDSNIWDDCIVFRFIANCSTGITSYIRYQG